MLRRRIHRCWLIQALALLLWCQLKFPFFGLDCVDVWSERELFEAQPHPPFEYEQQLSDLDTDDENGRFAYVFLIAGCDPAQQRSYRGFFYNVLVARHILRNEGSTADVVLMIRMINNATTSLPPEQEQVLRDADILIRYLPPPVTEETLYSAMMAKLFILNMTEYSRVLYMDADIMPWCNLDYLFQLSVKRVLKENVVVSWWLEPATGGFFMVKPKVGALNELHEIVKRQKEHAKELSLWPPFDVGRGWGHEIEPPDKWRTLSEEEGTNWTFQFAFADQGLLYHWVKYVRKRVSIVHRREVENWSERNGKVFLEKTLSNPFENFTCPLTRWDYNMRAKLTNGIRSLRKVPLYHDFTHFAGVPKPWEKVAQGVPPDVDKKSDARNPTQLWFHILRKVRNESNLSFDVHRLRVKRPLLGSYPTFHEMATYSHDELKL